MYATQEDMLNSISSETFTNAFKDIDNPVKSTKIFSKTNQNDRCTTNNQEIQQ